MKHKFAILLLLVFLASCMNNREKSGMEVPYDLNAIEERYETALKQLSDSIKLPRSYQSGKLNMVKPNDWTSGFFPGCLWLIHELTGKDSWRTEAEKWCRLLESQQHNDGTHDLGFMMFCSFGNGYRLYKSDTYLETIISSYYRTGTYKSYSWIIPSDLSTGSSYSIKITDVSDTSTYDFSNYFSIEERSLNLKRRNYKKL